EFPGSILLIARNLFKLIYQVFDKINQHGINSLTLGDREKVAHCECVILYILTGNVKHFPYSVWKRIGLAQSLTELGFPYFDPRVFDIRTRTLVPSDYCDEPSSAKFASTRAIEANFGKAAGLVYLQESRQDLALMLALGPHGVQILHGKRGMGTITFSAEQAAPFLDRIVQQYLQELTRQAHKAFSSMIHDWTRQALKEVNDSTANNKQRDRSIAKLENSKTEASVALATWVELPLTGDRFRWMDLKDLSKALSQLHHKPENVKPLLSTTDPYSFREVARTLVHQVWPHVATGSDLVKPLPKVKGGLWMKSLKPLGKAFGIGPDTYGNMNVHDLCDSLAEALARSGIECLPAKVCNPEWFWTFKKWREVVHWVGQDDNPEDAPGTPGQADDDEEDDFAFPASPTMNRRKSTKPTKGKTRLDPQLFDFTQVNRRRDHEIDLFADWLGFKIKNGKINIAQVWQERLNNYLGGIAHLDKKVTRRWQRWARSVHPENDLHRPLSKKTPKSVITYDRLEIVANRHRKKDWIFCLLVIMGVLQFSPTTHTACDNEEPNIVKMHNHFQYAKVDLRYLQLLGLGQANGMRPQFPAPSTGLFLKKSVADVVQMSVSSACL
ncbi:hypothetical protein JCM11251_003016, partial [Rhodosporidiobolus azoricus]